MEESCICRNCAGPRFIVFAQHIRCADCGCDHDDLRRATWRLAIRTDPGGGVAGRGPKPRRVAGSGATYGDCEPRYVEASCFAEAILVSRAELIAEWKSTGDYRPSDDSIEPESVELVSEESVLHAERLTRLVRIRFDGPPGPKPGRFVEIEDVETGASIRLGEWRESEAGGDWFLVFVVPR